MHHAPALAQCFEGGLGNFQQIVRIDQRVAPPWNHMATRTTAASAHATGASNDSNAGAAPAVMTAASIASFLAVQLILRFSVSYYPANPGSGIGKHRV